MKTKLKVGDLFRFCHRDKYDYGRVLGEDTGGKVYELLSYDDIEIGATVHNAVWKGNDKLESRGTFKFKGKRANDREPHEVEAERRRAFDDLTDAPCPACLRLAKEGGIQPRAVMPLPTHPGRSRTTAEQICRDCQATENMMGFNIGQHPIFSAARLTVANERCEGLVMPLGMMEVFGMCAEGYIDACSFEDQEAHRQWLHSHGIPDAACCIEEEHWFPDDNPRVQTPRPRKGSRQSH